MATKSGLLVVSAHPDDESIATGATLAGYAGRTTVVTCTQGEEGEIFDPSIAGLTPDQLGVHRAGELAAACAALGVDDHRFLGGPGYYRDSGMDGMPSNDHPRAFCRASIAEAAELLAGIIAEVRAEILICDNPVGTYGHPDHVQTHRVAMAAAEITSVPHVYWTEIPRSVVTARFHELRSAVGYPFAQVQRPEDLSFGTPDIEITTRVDGSAYAAVKQAALRAHRSQIPPGSWLWPLAGDGVEFFRRVTGSGPDRLAKG